MPLDANEDQQRMEAFLNREFNWTMTAGEVNFLLQLLAYIVQENPAFVPTDRNVKDPLNYQNIRTIVLLNEKLAGQLQHFASDSSVILGGTPPVSDRVQ